jgi:hypothetical protein
MKLKKYFNPILIIILITLVCLYYMLGFVEREKRKEIDKLVGEIDGEMD